MVKKSSETVIREVSEFVSDTIRRNRRSEWLITILLVVQFLAGLALLTIGAALEQ